jgi:hypothetical protein
MSFSWDVIDLLYHKGQGEGRRGGWGNRLTRGHPSTGSGQAGEGETRGKSHSLRVAASPCHRVVHVVNQSPIKAFKPISS